MKFGLIFILIIVSFTYYSETKLKRRKWCHANEVLFGCTNGLRSFTARINGTGIPTKSREFDAFCYFSLNLLPNCIRKWTHKCGSEMYLELIEQTYIKTLTESFTLFCQQSNKEKFLKHSPCLHEEVKLSHEYRTDCVKQIQSSFEYSHLTLANSSSTIKFRSICCAYNRWENCIKKHLLNKCGDISDEIIVDLIRAGTSSFIQQFCPISDYDPLSDDCKKLMPINFAPKGIKSESLFSFMFSYWCPNVGYGIIPQRD